MAWHRRVSSYGSLQWNKRATILSGVWTFVVRVHVRVCACVCVCVRMCVYAHVCCNWSDIADAMCCTPFQSVLGRGSYFTESASYIDVWSAFKNSDDEKQVVLATVLCGCERDYGMSVDRKLRRPPGDCDSVVGGPWAPSSEHRHDMATHSRVWVVFDFAQSYPEYVVTYKHASM